MSKPKKDTSHQHYLKHYPTKYFFLSKLMFELFKSSVYLFQNSLPAKLTGKEGEAASLSSIVLPVRSGKGHCDMTQNLLDLKVH